jgi:uncharacterized repeat protein (TIGR01451 family)
MKPSLHFLKKNLSIMTFAFSAALQAQNITAVVSQQPCNNDGQISVTVTGLTPPIIYTYNNWMANTNIVHSNVNALTDVLTNVPAYHEYGWGGPNQWVVTASDGNNTVNTWVTITPPFSDSVLVKPGNCPAPNTLQAVGLTGGTPPYAIVWKNRATLQTYNTNPAFVPDGDYEITITDGAGCVVQSSPSFSAAIAVNGNSGINVSIAGTNANCTNGTATVSASGGKAPYTYLWSNAATSSVVTGLMMGSYFCTVTDSIGCSTKQFQWISQLVNINYNSSITNATCLQNDGAVLSFVSGGTGPYSYFWSNGATTQNLSNVPGGYYSLKITDAVGCIGSGGAFVAKTTPITVTYNTTASSCTSATGGATLVTSGGVSPYTIIWSTFPNPSTGTSISNKPAGSYFFKVTDVNGCVQTGNAVIPPASLITANISANNVICPGTSGNIVASAGGSTPPFTYKWSNGATTSSLTGVPLGAYSCTITDAAGCKVTKHGSIDQVSPITVGFNTSNASCVFSNNGSAHAKPIGGQSPYSYLWSNGQTGVTATQLVTGNYYVTVTDANGCKNNPYNSYVHVGYNQNNNSCYCLITGSVYSDLNFNCVKNTGEVGISKVLIHCSGIGYAYTDANGVYSFKVPAGTYTITQGTSALYTLSGCETNNKVVTANPTSNCIIPVNFATKIIPVHDLHIITTNIGPAVVGGVYNQKVIIENDGSVTENTIKVGYKHDGQLGFSSSSPWTFSQQNASGQPNWYSIASGFPSLNPGGSSANIIQYNVPTNIPVNTTVTFQDTAAMSAPISTSWLADYTPWNNVNYHQTNVVASYDPNYKEVSPKGLTEMGNITKKDSVLTYVIHFQNTGSYFAQNIVLVDTLDKDLNMLSLRPGYSEHTFNTTMSESGVLKFHFNNINLPWKAGYGDIMSSGMVSYSIRMKKNLPLGTKFTNKAAIYFDYNEPVITNETVNTLVAPEGVGIAEIQLLDGDDVLLFPNPASDNFTVVFEGKVVTKGTLVVTDISGRQVSATVIGIEPGLNSITSETNNLQGGVYLVQINTGTETVTRKVVITK